MFWWNQILPIYRITFYYRMIFLKVFLYSVLNSSICSFCFLLIVNQENLLKLKFAQLRFTFIQFLEPTSWHLYKSTSVLCFSYKICFHFTKYSFNIHYSPTVRLKRTHSVSDTMFMHLTIIMLRKLRTCRCICCTKRYVRNSMGSVLLDTRCTLWHSTCGFVSESHI